MLNNKGIVNTKPQKMSKLNFSFITFFLFVFLSFANNLYAQSIEDYAKGKVKTGSAGAFIGFHGIYNVLDEWDGGFGAGFDFYGSKENKPTFYTSLSVSGLNVEDKRLDFSSEVSLINFRLGGALDGIITPYALATKGTTKVKLLGLSGEDSEWKFGVGMQFHIKTKNSMIVPGFEYNGYTEALALKIGILMSSD